MSATHNSSPAQSQLAGASLNKASPPSKKAAEMASAILAIVEEGTKTPEAQAKTPAKKLAYMIPEAARYIGCCGGTLRKWIKAGIGPKTFHLHGKKHLILHEELERWLKERAEQDGE